MAVFTARRLMSDDATSLALTVRTHSSPPFYVGQPESWEPPGTQLAGLPVHRATFARSDIAIVSSPANSGKGKTRCVKLFSTSLIATQHGPLTEHARLQDVAHPQRRHKSLVTPSSQTTILFDVTEDRAIITQVREKTATTQLQREQALDGNSPVMQHLQLEGRSPSGTTSRPTTSDLLAVLEHGTARRLRPNAR